MLHLIRGENNRELIRKKRSAPQYEIIPRLQRISYWDDSYEDFESYEDLLEQAWLDGDFGMKSRNYKENIFTPHKQKRRQRNIKVNNQIIREIVAEAGKV